jgi:hypothetical protein
MPVSKELTIRMEDKPGTLGKVCRALADQEVNILAFQSIPSEGASLVRVVLDNPTTAKKVLDNERVKYSETDVAQVELSHRPGELARAATKLGEAGININYAYGGVDPTTTQPMLIFGVAEVAKTAKILDETVAKAA